MGIDELNQVLKNMPTMLVSQQQISQGYLALESIAQELENRTISHAPPLLPPPPLTLLKIIILQPGFNSGA